MGFISDEQLVKIALLLSKTQYGEYLQAIVKEKYDYGTRAILRDPQ